MAVRSLGKVDANNFEEDAFTKQFVVDKLTHLSARLAEITASNMAGLRVETLGFIDTWLQTLVELDELQCTGEGCSLCRRDGGTDG